jgi:hypothetical protein
VPQRQADRSNDHRWDGRRDEQRHVDRQPTSSPPVTHNSTPPVTHASTPPSHNATPSHNTTPSNNRNDGNRHDASRDHDGDLRS